MSSKDTKLDDIVEVSVPPLSMANEERDISNGQDIDLVEFADFAKSKAGTPGGIGVALDSLQALSEDLDTFAQTGAAPGDLELHAEALQEVVRILCHVADDEIDSYDAPLYTSSNSESIPEDKDSESVTSSKGEAPIPSENLMKVTVDRISNSGNLIAEPVDSGPKHIHVQNGAIGETAVAYKVDGTLTSQGGENKPYTFPCKSKQEVRTTYEQGNPIPLTEGQSIQIHNASKEEGFVYIDAFDLRAIKVDDDINDGATVLLEITEVKTNTAVAHLKDQTTQSTNSQKFLKFDTSSTTTKQNSGANTTTKSKSGGIPKISSGPAGSKNDLLSGKKH